MSERKPVIVCTERQGLFFGYCENDGPQNMEEITLHNARMCVEWRGMRGALDLAVTGPNEKCKISPPVAFLQITKLSGFFPCSEVSARQWEKGFWYVDPEDRDE